MKISPAHAALALAALSTLFPFSYGAAADSPDATSPAVVLSPFEVSAGSTKGYRALNTISATRINIPLNEVPMNIAVITSEFMFDAAVMGQREALRWSPGVNDKNVRGLNTDEFLRQGFLHLSDFSPYSLDRIEIIRGPSAVLQGISSPGGVINMIPKLAVAGRNFASTTLMTGAPRAYANAFLDVNVGNLGPRLDHGHLLAFRIVGGYEYAEGLSRFGNRKVGTYTPSIRLQPTANTTISVDFYRYDMTTDRADRLMGMDLTIGNRSLAQGEIPLAASHGVPIEANWNGPGWQAPEDVADLSGKIQHRFTDNFSMEFAGNIHNRALNFIEQPGPVTALRPGAPAGSVNPADWVINRFWNRQLAPADIDQYRISGHYQFNWGRSKQQIVFGYQSSDFKRTTSRWQAFSSTNPTQRFFETFEIANWNTDSLEYPQGAFYYRPLDANFVHTTQSSPYFNHQGRWQDGRLISLVGLYRADIATLTRRDTYNGLGFVPQVDNSGDKWLPQAGLLYFLDEARTINLFANFSRSTNPNLAAVDGFGNPFTPGYADSIEVGTKFELFEGKVHGTVSAYQVKDQGRIVNDPNAPNRFTDPTQPNSPRGANVQVGVLEARGIDLDFYLYPTPNWSIIAGYSWNDTEITEDPNPDVQGRAQNGTFNHKLVVWNKYTVTHGPMKGLFLGGGINWRSETLREYRFNQKANPTYFDPITRIDALLGYEGTWGGLPFRVTVNAKNLARQDNLSNNLPRRDLQFGYKPNSNDPYVFKSDPEYTVSLTFNF